eukprot:scaffold32538_cov46-Attheya_sp.AAC.3
MMVHVRDDCSSSASPPSSAANAGAHRNEDDKYKKKRPSNAPRRWSLCILMRWIDLSVNILLSAATMSCKVKYLCCLLSYIKMYGHEAVKKRLYASNYLSIAVLSIEFVQWIVRIYRLAIHARPLFHQDRPCAWGQSTLAPLLLHALWVVNAFCFCTSTSSNNRSGRRT